LLRAGTMASEGETIPAEPQSTEGMAPRVAK
jgi:hypothetical protein